MKTPLPFALTILLLVSPVLAQNRNELEGRSYSTDELAERFSSHEYKGVPYRFLQPPALNATRVQLYPLILSLHGAGGKGSDNLVSLRTWNGVLSEPSFQKKYPCFVLAPQSPSYWLDSRASDLSERALKTYPEVWRKALAARKGLASPSNPGSLDEVFKLIDSLAEQYPIDLDRVYVLGHSMGGFGSWTAIASEPDRFAAAIPSAGGLSPWYDVKTIAHVPIWAFHGEDDRTVGVEFTRVPFEQLSKVKGNMKYTEVENVNHNVNAQAFAYAGDGASKRKSTTKYSSSKCDRTSNVWDWLFKQKRTP